MSPEAYLKMAQTEASHWWFTGRRAILHSTLSGLGLPPNSRILEIGSGTGGNLEMLAGFGKNRRTIRYPERSLPISHSFLRRKI